MQKTRILVTGGYGFFRRKLVERLSKQTGLHITTAGRSVEGAETLASKLRTAARYDFADGREFVAGIGASNSAALKAGVLASSGVSFVPALILNRGICPYSEASPKQSYPGRSKALCRLTHSG